MWMRTAWLKEKGVKKVKVTSHQNKMGFDYTGTLPALFANSAADQLAALATAEHQHDPILVARIQYLDKATTVMAMMVHFDITIMDTYPERVFVQVPGNGCSAWVATSILCRRAQ